MKYKKAIDILGIRVKELGGAVFARYILDFVSKNKETLNLSEESKESLKSAEAMVFFEGLMNGKFNDKTKFDVENMPEYKEMMEISSAIQLLQESN